METQLSSGYSTCLHNHSPKKVPLTADVGFPDPDALMPCLCFVDMHEYLGHEDKLNKG